MDGAPFQTAHNESSVSELELELELPGKKVTLGLSLQMLDTAMIVMGRKGKSDQYSMHYNMHIMILSMDVKISFMQKAFF